MKRDSILPVILPALAVLAGTCALVSYAKHRRSCQHACGRAAAADVEQPLQTWEEEGGALPRSAQTGAEPPGA